MPLEEFSTSYKRLALVDRIFFIVKFFIRVFTEVIGVVDPVLVAKLNEASYTTCVRQYDVSIYSAIQLFQHTC